mmetsp:Transcript_596/g.1689  ORF Transcript_596/g.1689 Transcript_596/m.1689 type:complete len:103 (+) Transcript_596:295-603(+)
MLRPQTRSARMRPPIWTMTNERDRYHQCPIINIFATTSTTTTTTMIAGPYGMSNTARWHKSKQERFQDARPKRNDHSGLIPERDADDSRAGVTCDIRHKSLL